jgi:TonB family protein
VFGDVGGDGLMKRRFLAAAVLSLLLSNTAYARAPKAKALKTNYGESLTLSGRNQYLSLQLRLPFHWEADPKLYRFLNYDYERLNTGYYPVAALRAGEEGNVSVLLEIDATGAVVSCVVTQSSDVPSLDADACAHLKTRQPFVAPLGADGIPRGEKFWATLMYSLQPPSNSAMLDPSPRPDQRAKARRHITWSDVGMADQPNFLTPSGAITGLVTVEADGKVSACTLRYASNSDMFDKIICDRVKSLDVFDPARSSGIPVGDNIWFEVQRPE